MWKWDDALGNKWARVAMCSQRLNIPINMPEGIKEERRGTSWARATRELRRLRHRIEEVGGSKDQWEAGVWHMDKEQWNLLWTEEFLDLLNGVHHLPSICVIASSNRPRMCWRHPYPVLSCAPFDSLLLVLFRSRHRFSGCASFPMGCSRSPRLGIGGLLDPFAHASRPP